MKKLTPSKNPSSFHKGFFLPANFLKRKKGSKMTVKTYGNEQSAYARFELFDLSHELFAVAFVPKSNSEAIAKAFQEKFAISHTGEGTISPGFAVGIDTAVFLFSNDRNEVFAYAKISVSRTS
jgi:hypothetical protein